jgi:hypothetical protein
MVPHNRTESLASLRVDALSEDFRCIVTRANKVWLTMIFCVHAERLHPSTFKQYRIP